MPAIQVARTDTFEQQRVKINDISDVLFSVTSGGSDLSTGNLKLGDGTRTTPSLAFTTDSSLGVYKYGVGSLGFVSGSKDIFSFSESEVFFYKTSNFSRRVIDSTTGSTFILDAGSDYGVGSYTDVILLGGNGSGALANLEVFEHVGTSTVGNGYYGGTYTNIALSGGSGSGANIDFTVETIAGTITQAGSNYTPGLTTDVPLTGGNGSGAIADISVSELAVTISSGGTTYPDGTYLDIPLTGGNGSDARGNIDVIGGAVSSITVTNSGIGYTITDVLSVNLFQSGTQTFSVTVNTGVFSIDGEIRSGFNLVNGQTYEFDQLDSSNDSDALCIGTTANDTNTALGSADGVTYVVDGVTYNTYTDYVANISPTNTERKVVFAVPASPANANVFFFGPFGGGGSLTLVANAGSAAALDVSTVPGEVISVAITFSGSGYLQNDVLSATLGTGAGFQFTVSNNPGILNDFTFSSRGGGYLVGEVLTLPGVVSGVTATLEAEITGLTTTLVAADPQITVSSTAGIQVGYIITSSVGPGSTFPGATVASIDSPTQLTMSANPDIPGSCTLTFTPPNSTEITVSDATGINAGATVTVTSGSGALVSGTTVVSASGTTVVLSDAPTSAGAVTLSFSPPYGPGTGWSYTITAVGAIGDVTISTTQLGVGYTEGDILTVSPSDLAAPIDYTVTTVAIQILTLVGTVNLAASGLAVGDLIEVQGSGGAGSEIYDIKTSGGNITSIVVSDGNFQDSDVIIELGQSTTQTIDTVVSRNVFFIDTGSGAAYKPDLTLYSGDTYNFDYSDPTNVGHEFSISEFRDGPFSPSLVEGVSIVLDTLTTVYTIADTTGILVGMEVSVTAGNGELSATTKVASVDSATQITLNEVPTVGGDSTVKFAGSQYLTGTNRENNILSLTITDDTPSTLYYYCTFHENMAGEDNDEAVLTIDLNNPRTFGSGFQLRIDSVIATDVIINDITEGKVTSLDLESENATITAGTVTTLTSTSGTIDNITTESISSTGLNISSTGTTNISSSGNISINSNITIEPNGDIATSGNLETDASVVVSNVLTITGSDISTSGGNNLTLTPDVSRLVKADTTTALVIPVGTTNERPQAGVVEDGAIRFNSETNQYEGYASTTSSWSSLGGIRDLDGNTYILAEETVGANDNTLWFYNDGVNTLKVTPSGMDFRSVKTIQSSNTAAPSFVDWTSNTPVQVGDYIRYRNNLYEVTTAGTTDTTGNEPTHSSGAALNGSAELTFWGLAVAPLEFEFCDEVRVGPQKDVPLVISSELRFLDNVISTDVQDMVLRPNAGKKIVVDTNTSFAVPSGATADRGVPVQGSIRFNTTNFTYEGYDGTNWGSLGGVKDVDQNTYIIPETVPGANENILYFYNDANNTVQITTTALDFYSIDTIRSVTSDELEITASLLTFDQGTSTFDNTSVDRTFLHTTKQYFDIGLSAGVTVDPVLRLDDQGDVYLNIGFGTGVFDGVKVFDGDLKEFELADVRILSEKITLVKGTSNNGSSELYETATNLGCKTTVIAHNPTTGDKEFYEFGVLDDGTDIFHTEYGNIRTGTQLILPTFEITGANVARLNIELGANVGNTESVNITVVSNVTKK